MASAFVVAIFALVTTAAAVTDGYTNHTVGGDAGWLFNSTTKKTSADYKSWAVNQTFNLGDYLIFNTNSNQTVIQTYNETIYKNCNDDDASDSDVFEYDGGSDVFGEVMTIAIPLTIEGSNYYFSYPGDDSVQCENGMAFEIAVQHGLGLPPSLNQPPPPPYTPPASPSDAQSPTTATATTNQKSEGSNLRQILVYYYYALLLFFGILLL
ncbi:cucumber peeling cupredoxin-like [Impatiens glandulifera]|uniref:cucumber peeling cupredoxin-like n=1 Tax=Impatiens glandulifera TaxID=253017 RepID=UPI001FB09DB2|nr:cucumber peeling cupredoxin-like [Impatiens glandulifera]